MTHTRTITRWSMTMVLGPAMLMGLSSCNGRETQNTSTTPETAPTPSEAKPSAPKRYFSIAADGTLERPEGYREWIFVGEPVTPNEMNGGKAPFPEFHSVYIDPPSYEEYRTTGTFPDGTILIKELHAVGSTSAASGKGFFMGDYIGLEATIKSAEHFPDEPGNWAYFSFTNPDGGRLRSKAKAFPTKDCNACHQASAAQDFVFTQYYPVLSGAKDEELAEGNTPYTLTDGVLERPRGYRRWVFVGEPLTPNDRNGGKAPFPEFHSVYIDPESHEHLKKTGEFREGTILIKELVSVGSKQAASGSGYFMGEFIGLEATIKSKKDFPDEPGGWAYFSFTNPAGALKDQAEPFATAQCNSCHQNNAAQDFVFTQYYPTLRDAIEQSKGKSLPTDNQWQPTAPHPESEGGLPLGRTELHAWLRSAKYSKSFAAKETGTHPGRGPHTEPSSPVRVFYNSTLAKSLEAGNTEHPKGSVAVKEMHGKDGTLGGWAVMAKTGAETNDGKNWFWYEVTSTTDAGALPAAGNGIPGCISCHRVGGSDLILSGWPLK